MKRLLLLLALLTFGSSGLVTHAQKIKVPCSEPDHRVTIAIQASRGPGR